MRVSNKKIFDVRKGKKMKNIRHFLLIPIYVFTVTFVLVINGVFSGNVEPSAWSDILILLYIDSILQNL